MVDRGASLELGKSGGRPPEADEIKDSDNVVDDNPRETIINYGNQDIEKIGICKGISTGQKRPATYPTQLKIMVSPIRIRVLPLAKVLQMRCTRSGSVTAETVTPPDSPATSIYITSTSPSAQCLAMVCKPVKKIPLR
jgi:hypothetical protein